MLSPSLPIDPSCRARNRWMQCVLGGLVLVTLVFAPERSAAQSEDQVKAAFLLNFARYVEWPGAAFPAADAPVQICVIGTDGFRQVVANTTDGKLVHERPVTARAIQSAEEAADCHVLYVGGEALSGAAGARALAKLRASNLLIVGDRKGFAEKGGIANFYRAGNKIRFEVNPDFANEAGLKISSKLLRLARIVGAS